MTPPTDDPATLPIAGRRDHAATPVTVPVCHDEVCVTCSDQAVEVRVVALLDGGMARVDAGPTIEEVDVSLVDATVGDRLLVHAKVAIGHAS